MDLHTDTPIQSNSGRFIFWLSTKRPLPTLCAFCLLSLVPFAGRPFHVDDPVFIWVAQHIVHHPGNFYGFDINWGRRDFPVSTVFLSPPLTSYYLAAASLLCGWGEFQLHLAFLPFSVLTVIGLFFLSENFCNRPGLC